MNMSVKIDISNDQITEFCRHWQIERMSIFGSALRDDFRPDSDVDVLVVFDEKARWNLFDLVRAEGELAAIFGRKVDLVERKAVRNPFRRHHILSHHEVLYAA
jgi:predicted nucleotidyltransferase